MTAPRIAGFFMAIVAVSGLAQSPQVSGNGPRTNGRFDGRWWLRAEKEERAGFIEGAADCLTWTVHEKGFNSTSQQLAEQISGFYKAHPENVGVGVVEVWKGVAGSSPSNPNAPELKGETWSNPHWYLNADWWGSVSLLEDAGYLEGYLWCTDNCAAQGMERYSQPVAFYQKRVDAYIEAHPKSGSEAVADILRRFHDSR